MIEPKTFLSVILPDGFAVKKEGRCYRSAGTVPPKASGSRRVLFIFFAVILAGMAAPLTAKGQAFFYQEGFESGLGIWTQSAEDDCDWTRHTGYTSSSATGPAAAQEGSWYVYTEASSPNSPNKRFYLEADFDFSNLSDHLHMLFYYHMYGCDCGSLAVDVFDGAAWHEAVWSVSGQQQTSYSSPWTCVQVPLGEFIGLSNAKIRFRGISGTSYQSDIAVDNIVVTTDYPPVAFSQNLTLPVSRRIEITLQGSDPDADEITDCQIVDAPLNGQLSPLNTGQAFIYSMAGEKYRDSFTFKVWAAGTASEPATVTLSLPDTDGDTLPDLWEIDFLNTLDFGAGDDPDQDSLCNIDELNAGTDPDDSDSDHDGMPDGWEVTVGLNPLDPADALLDPDSDNLTNLQEYERQFNPHNSDSDCDGIPDGSELGYSNPLGGLFLSLPFSFAGEEWTPFALPFGFNLGNDVHNEIFAYHSHQIERVMNGQLTPTTSLWGGPNTGYIGKLLEPPSSSCTSVISRQMDTPLDPRTWLDFESGWNLIHCPVTLSRDSIINSSPISGIAVVDGDSLPSAGGVPELSAQYTMQPGWSEMVSINTVPFFSESFSVSFWLKAAPGTSGMILRSPLPRIQTILSAFIPGGSDLVIEFEGRSVACISQAFSDGDWHHVICSVVYQYGGCEYRIFLDGQPRAGNQFSPPCYDSGAPWLDSVTLGQSTSNSISGSLSLLEFDGHDVLTDLEAQFRSIHEEEITGNQYDLILNDDGFTGDTFAIQFWMNPNNSSSNGMILRVPFVKIPGYLNLLFMPGDRLDVDIEGNYTAQISGLALNAWQHVAVLVGRYGTNQCKLKVYLNAQLVRDDVFYTGYYHLAEPWASEVVVGNSVLPAMEGKIGRLRIDTHLDTSALETHVNLLWPCYDVSTSNAPEELLRGSVYWFLADQGFGVDARQWMLDTDGDGLDDTWEQFIVDHDPEDQIFHVYQVAPMDDYDQDGLSNALEFSLYLDPAAEDSDGDTMSDVYEIQQPGLVAKPLDVQPQIWWKLDELIAPENIFANARRDTGNAFDAHFEGDPTGVVQPALLNSGVNFVTDSQITLQNTAVLDPWDEVSITFWIKADPSYCNEIFNWADVWIGMSSRLEVSTLGFWFEGPTVTDGTWHHVQLSIDPDSMSALFVDGVQVDYVDLSLTPYSLNPLFENPLILRGTPCGTATLTVDDVRIFNKALNAGHALQLSEPGKDPDSDGVLNVVEAQYGTLCNEPDTDMDGIPDGWEITYMPATDPLIPDSQADPDYDGFTNYYEFTHAMNPSLLDVEIAIAEGPSIDVEMDEDGAPVPFDLTLHAVDSGTGTLTWTVSVLAAHGTASITEPAAGPETDVQYAPDPNWHGADSFQVTVDDGEGHSVSIIVNVTVNSVNDSPAFTCVIDPVYTEDTGYSISIQVTDPDAEDTSPTDFVYSLENAPSTMTVDSQGIISFHPSQADADESPFNDVRVIVADGGERGAMPAISTYSFSVIPVNDVPIITEGGAIGVIMDEDGNPVPFSLTLHAVDEEDDPITWSLSSNPLHGIASVSGTGLQNVIGYTPFPNWHGLDSFIVSVSNEGETGYSCITVNVAVNPRNDSPVNTEMPVVSGTWHVGAQLSTTTGTWNDNIDMTPGVLTYTYQWQRADDDQGTNAMAIGEAAAATYDPVPADNAKYICVTVTAADDGEGLPETRSTSVTTDWQLVDNAVPVIAQGDSVTAVMDEDGAPAAWITPTITATDDDNDTLTWSLDTQAANGTAVVSGTGPSPVVTYSPNADWHGTDSFVIQVDDGLGGNDTITVNVTVNPVNDDPIIIEGETVSATVEEDASLRSPLLTIHSTDADGDPLTTAVLEPGPGHGSVSIVEVGDNAFAVMYHPDEDYNGADIFQVLVTDGNATDSVTVDVTVTACPDAPQVTADSYSGTEDTILLVSVPGVLGNDTDPDAGDALTVTLETEPMVGALTLNSDGSFEYQPPQDFNGDVVFTYTATDGVHTSEPAVVTLTFVGSPDTPEAAADSYRVMEDQSLVVPMPGVLINDTDGDGDSLSAVLVTAPSHAQSFTLNADGSFSYVPVAGYSGGDVFSYCASDGALQSDVSIVTLTIVPSTYQPVAVIDSYTLAEDEYIAVSAYAGVLANDSSEYAPAADFAAVLDSNVAHGTLTFSPDGSFTYIPTPDFCGTDGFTYRLNDGIADSAACSVTLNVTGINDAPEFVQEATTSQDPVQLPAPALLPGTVTLTVSVIDADNDALIFTWSKLSGPGEVTFAPNGTAAAETTTAGFESPGNYVLCVIIDDGSTFVTSEIALTVLPFEPRILFVDCTAAGTEDGLSWDNAFTELHDALQTAVMGDQIWVAAGTYKPTDGTDRTLSFEPASGVELYGGFAGHETVLANRDWETNNTVLSGDIGVLGDFSDNSYHVVAVWDRDVILDGFVVEAGNADETDLSSGGGIIQALIGFSSVTSLILANCTIQDCMGANGAALHLSHCTPFVRNCLFQGNSCYSNGGAVYIQQNSLPVFEGCRFFTNEASEKGGAVYSTGSSPVFSGCEFSGNIATNGGGAVYELGEGSIKVGPDNYFRNCEFTGNSVTSTTINGGGAIFFNSTSANVVHCVFSDNSAGAFGGALIGAQYSGTITNSTFAENNSTYGGAFYDERGTVTFVGCLFSNNSAFSHGGSGYLVSSSPSFANCTFFGNRCGASSYGGGLIVLLNESSYPGTGSEVTVENCILWNDCRSDGVSTTTDEITAFNSYSAAVSVTLTNCALQYTGALWYAGDYPFVFNGQNYLDVDPVFVDASIPTGADGVYGTDDDGLRIVSGSVCVDSGDNTILPGDITDVDDDGDSSETLPLDLRMRRRVSNDIVDMGAYELRQGSDAGILYVDAARPAGGNGRSWATAFNDLQSALAAAIPNDEIWVAAGTYIPSSTGDRSVSFVLRDQVSLYGGFAGTETALEQRDWETNITILSGDLAGDDNTGVPVTDPARNNTDNAYCVVAGAEDAVFDGFTVSGGNADGASPVNRGAGMLNNACSPAVRHCTFSANISSNNGAAMANVNASPNVVDCLFTGNHSAYGGAVSATGSAAGPLLCDCRLTDNSADQYGGGIFAWNDSKITAVACQFQDNTAPFGGAWSGFLVQGAFLNCAFDRNSATRAGGAMREYGCVTEIVGCVFAENSADIEGGAYSGVSTATALINCTLARNTADISAGVMVLSLEPDDLPGIGSSVLLENTIIDADAEDDMPVLVENNDTLLEVQITISNSSIPGVLYYIGSDPYIIDQTTLRGVDTSFLAPGSPAGADGILGTDDDGLRLRGDSPCLDTALASALPEDIWDLDEDEDTTEYLPLDLTGGMRVVGSAPDMGAYERAGGNLSVPETYADSYTLLEDTPLAVPASSGLLINDTDADGDALDAILDTNSLHGQVVLLADGSFTYTPVSDFHGSDSFSYYADDGLHDSPTTTVTLRVISVDDPPTGGTLPDIILNAANPQQTLDLGNYFSDVDSVLSYELLNTNPHIVLASMNGAQLTLARVADWSGIGAVLVTATGDGYSVSGTISVTVEPDSGVSAVASSSPGSGSIVARPADGSDLYLHVTMSAPITDPGLITVLDRFGNDISANVAMSSDSLQLLIDPMDGYDPAEQGGGLRTGEAILGEYLSGITHYYTVIVGEQAYTISFTVDPWAPTVVPGIVPGRYAGSIGPVVLSSPDSDIAAIYYTVNGASAVPDIRYGQTPALDETNLTFSSTAVVACYAVDAAGNRGPTCTFVYTFDDLPTPPVLAEGDFYLDTDHIAGTWTEQPDCTYHVYRALSAGELNMLEEAAQGIFPPPRCLRVTSAALTDEVYTEADSAVPGTNVYYAVTAIDVAGTEGPPSNTVMVQLSDAAPVENDPGDAVSRATRRLLADQKTNGSWVGRSESMTATAAALRGLLSTDRFGPSALPVSCARAYLAGHPAGDVGGLAWAESVLQMLGYSSGTLQAALHFHARIAVDRAGNNPTVIGWGAQYRCEPDALNSALALAAYTGSQETSPTTVKALEFLAGQNVMIGSGGDVRTLPGAAILAIDSHYGHTPGGPSSVFVSALSARALNRNHYSDISANQWMLDTQQTADPGADNYGGVGAGLLDTAAALRSLPWTDAAARELAREFLARCQNPDGSWLGDAFLTGICLEALVTPRVIYVYSGGTPNAYDVALQNMLAARGFAADLTDDDSPVPDNIKTSAFVLISGTASAAAVANRYADVQCPVIVCCPDLLDDMRLTGPDEVGTDTGTFLQIVESEHRLAAGFPEGSQSVLQTTGAIGWGRPGDQATVIATALGDYAKGTVFVYPPGSFLPGGQTAPARRAAFFFADGTDALTDAGKDLFDALIEWAVSGKEAK